MTAVVVDVGEVADALLARGAVGGQITVLHEHRELCDVAFGVDHLGAPLRRDHLLAWYCTGKPLVALALLIAVERGQLRLDDPLRQWLPEADGTWIGDITVRDVVDHRAGLHALPSVIARITPERDRFGLVLDAPLPPDFLVGRDVTYSEFAAWYLLGGVLQRATGRPFAESIAEDVCQPLGLADDCFAGLPGAAYDREAHRIACSIAGTADGDVPLLAERGRRTAGEWNPAFGTYATAGAMARCADAVLDDVEGAGRLLPATALGPLLASAEMTPAPNLGRDVAFRLGWMVGLDRQGFGAAISSRSFGHSGQGGLNFVAVDVERRLTIACRTIRLFDREAGVETLRPWLVDRLVEVVR